MLSCDENSVDFKKAAKGSNSSMILNIPKRGPLQASDRLNLTKSTNSLLIGNNPKISRSYLDDFFSPQSSNLKADFNKICVSEDNEPGSSQNSIYQYYNMDSFSADTRSYAPVTSPIAHDYSSITFNRENQNISQPESSTSHIYDIPNSKNELFNNFGLTDGLLNKDNNKYDISSDLSQYQKNSSCKDFQKLIYRGKENINPIIENVPSSVNLDYVYTSNVNSMNTFNANPESFLSYADNRSSQPLQSDSPGVYSHNSVVKIPSELDNMTNVALKVKVQESAEVISQLQWRIDELVAELEMVSNNYISGRHLLNSEALINEDNCINGNGTQADIACEKQCNSTNIKSQSTMTDLNDEATAEKGNQVNEFQLLKHKLNRVLLELDSEKIRAIGRDREIKQLRLELLNRGVVLDSETATVKYRTRSSSLSSVSTEFTASAISPGLILSNIGIENMTLEEGINSQNQNIQSHRSQVCSNQRIPNDNLYRGVIRNGGLTKGSREDRSYSEEYRQMLEKDFEADWPALIENIVESTDQRASIYLQQKLKYATPPQRDSIFKAMLNRSHHLMTNRFGNFLVQRCFEFGTPQQKKAIANEMVGKVLQLSTNPFGCHVVQKALDCVDEDIKAALVSELFRKIPETIIHKYACHVWQKVFEIRWTSAPPAVMNYVNSALVGQWHKVALDETGSLVVQNIFENLGENDKRSVINEILNHVILISKGQWGNWVIQHILDQGLPNDRIQCLNVIIEEAVHMSLDQFASKVVEKALRTGGKDVIDRFINRVCLSSQDRPRIPLIDIASDQYGNYVIQFLLNNAIEDQKEQLRKLLRRHMVSLRGSKYGQKVAFMVEKYYKDSMTVPELTQGTHRKAPYRRFEI